MSAVEPEEAELLRRVAAGDRAAVDQLFARHRDRLRWMIRLRLNRRLQGRVDPSDVLQEACLEGCRRLDEYLRAPRLPFFLWLRRLTALKLLALHRQHLRTGIRDANREAPTADWPEVNSAALAAEVVGKVTSPSAATIRAEAQAAVQSALEAMDSTDREVLVLRHFEALTNDEIAQSLGLTKTAASNRYVRALKRLRKILEAVPGLLDGAEQL
jgi:RNA polymerase sigma-70 factor (ECF subfamily)